MEAYTGAPRFPVWLVADSEPKNWHKLLLTPLDPRHPARHNIWTSVLEYMQEALYEQKRLRFDTVKLYSPLDKHRHNHVDVVIHPYWTDDTGA